MTKRRRAIKTDAKPIRTDAEIVTLGEKLAQRFAELDGWNLRKGESFREALHGGSNRVRRYWEMACIAFEELEQTPLDDALTSVQADESENAVEVLAEVPPAALYATPRERSEYFGTLTLGTDTSVPEYGDALRQAAAASTGLFGDTGKLKSECAKIAAYEIRKILREDERYIEAADRADLNWGQLRAGVPTQEMVATLLGFGVESLTGLIQDSGVFSNEFRQCRQRPMWELQNNLDAGTIGTAKSLIPAPAWYRPAEPREFLFRLIKALTPHDAEDEDE